MKTIKVLSIIAMVFTFNMLIAKRINLAVLNIDTHGVNYTPEQMGNLLRLELEKLDTFEVMDRYDVVYLVKKNNLDVANCYGKIGLVEAGNTIKSEKMISGSVDLYGETLIVTIRIINVPEERIEKTFVKEFLNLPNEMQSILRVSVREMFGLKNDALLVERLTKPYNYENLVNNPNKERLNLSGPRMGVIAFTGPQWNIIKASEKNGGYDLNPVMMQFGYQFEKLYLNEGNFQALFEFIPMITGLEQRTIMPSCAVLNGMRHNQNGWEFAFGPVISLASRAKVYYDEILSENQQSKADKKWHKETDWNTAEWGNNPNRVSNMPFKEGKVTLNSSFIFAVGKTIKSGKLNFPINLYFIPAREGYTFGLSVGFNAKNKV